MKAPKLKLAPRDLPIWAYRGLQRGLIEGLVLPRWMSAQRIQEERSQGLRARTLAERDPARRRAWFHAASVGELESLMPVILAWADRGGECVISVLSESARGSIERLRGELERFPGSLIYAGYSPWEGRWEETLLKARPDVFLTAKYEAWPELWFALGRLGVPLLIVSAKARRSLKLGRWLCRALGGRLPRIRMLTVSDDDSRELLEMLRGDPRIETERAGEPRWDRVQSRSLRSSPRAQELVRRFEALPRPWGVLGSVWPEDLEVWRGRFAKAGGTLWVVPHRVDAPSVERILRLLEGAGLRVVRSSSLSGRAGPGDSGEPQADAVLVDEMGFLLELYAVADWAFVGGGFGVSMHSTIEPAIFGIPVACGPNGARKFPEISELVATQQLTLVRHGDDLDAWLLIQGARAKDLVRRDAERARWLGQAKERLGATQRILSIIEGLLP